MTVGMPVLEPSDNQLYVSPGIRFFPAPLGRMMRKMRPWCAALLVGFLPWGAIAQDEAAAPVVVADSTSAPVVEDTRAFLEEVRRNLQSDGALLEQYTFIESYTEKRLNSSGAVKSTRTETYEVYPSTEPRKLYRRLVARDGQPISEKELAQLDRKQE